MPEPMRSCQRWSRPKLALDILANRIDPACFGKESHSESFCSLAEALGSLGSRREQGQWGFAGALARCEAALAAHTRNQRAAFICQCAYSLREAWDDGRRESDGLEVRSTCRQEMAYCACPQEDCQKLDAMRTLSGDRFDPISASRSAMAILEFGLRLWTRDEPARSAAGISYLAQCCHPFAQVPDSFLQALKPFKGAPMPESGDGLAMTHWPDDSTDDPKEFPWWAPAWALGRIDKGLSRPGYPWGLWLAICAPDRLWDWGKQMEADFERDGAIAAFLKDQDVDDWHADHRAHCKRAEGLLAIAHERRLIEASCEPGRLRAQSKAL